MAAPSVVVFSLKECPHCRRAKALLDYLGLAYEDVSLTDYPEKRSDMLQLASRLTVPQIFVQGRHIGGAEDLQELHDAGKLQERLDASPDGVLSDPRLHRPDYPPTPVVALPEAPEEPKIAIGSESLEYPALVKLLIESINAKDVSHVFSTTKQCFTGKDLSDFLERRFQLKSHEDAVQVCDQLLHSGVFGPADGAIAFSEKGLFRFQVHEASFETALNIARKWCTEQGCVSDAVQNPMGLMERLKGQLSKILSAHTDDNGMVDYVAMGEDPALLQYELAVAELQLVNLAEMEPTTRRAFVINLYNAIVPHAFAKVGIANTDLSRVAFFDGVSYLLGQHSDVPLSLNDLENGVLRGNRNAPFHLRQPLGSGSPHLPAVLDCDHRIHFALNCGAKSCPPVKWFTSEALDEELRVVAMAWAEQEDNVKIDLAAKTLWLSMIISWYSKDFGSSKVEIANTIKQHTHGEKYDQFKELLKGDFQLKHMNYDWSTNTRRSHEFKGRNLRALLGF